MKNRVHIIVFVIILAAINVSAQMPEPKYVWQKQDTLKIAYTNLLSNDGYKAQKLDWNKKRVIGAAFMLGFGALTYYYHQKAEDSYSQYLRSGSIVQMNSYFKKTENYDRLKGAASMGIEIGFLLTVWSFF